ncbi:MAG: hypothetical protein ACI8YQ_002228 [Polaribacter sp.]|jgi:hypothetical protein
MIIYIYILLSFLLLFILIGYALKPRIERKIQIIIQGKMTALNVSLIKIVKVNFPNTGPFQNKYRTTQINTMATIMGLYPDYTAFRKLITTNDVGIEKVYWIKIKFDIIEFKNVEIKEEA